MGHGGNYGSSFLILKGGLSLTVAHIYDDIHIWDDDEGERELSFHDKNYFQIRTILQIGHIWLTHFLTIYGYVLVGTLVICHYDASYLQL